MNVSLPPRCRPDEIVGGRYRILSELGHGGMSVVYRAQDRLLGHDIALKQLLLPDDDPRNLLFLQQEFRAMARLRHPRLVQVFDYGVLDNGSSYFTMELLAGEDLSEAPPLTFETIFQVLLSIADVLGFMHARGYVHRDVKPANVRVLSNSKGSPIDVKLMDCGLTEPLGREASAVAGTLAYLAPEAWLGAPPDVRADLYALGVLAYEITAGQLPFQAATGVRLLKAKTERPRDLREMRADVPTEFARLVSDLLTPEPANRPASAMEVVARLCEFANIDFPSDSAIFLRTPALVGRSGELSALRDAINDACSGKPTPTVIVGPAGAGKTRLLDEALLETGLRGAVIARSSGRGFAGGPYEVLEELIAPLLHLPAAESVLARLGGKAVLRPERLSLASDGSSREVDPVEARRLFHLAFAAFLDGISKHRMIVLAVDDIHMADAGSVDALASLIAGGVRGNVAIVATQRTGERVSQSLSHLLATARRFELDRMTHAQIGDLIVGAFGHVSPSSTLVADLERVSSGNVYFVLEILRSLATRGLIERKRTRICLPESLDAVDLPRSLTDALALRLDSLPQVALRLAQIVAVVGRALAFDFSRLLLGVSDEEFLDAVDDLRREELVDIQDGKLCIHHPRLREVLYQGLEVEQRRALHRRIAEQIQRRSAEEGRDRAAELGHHFAEAADAAQALTYLVMAGDARYNGFAYYDARDAYQRAFELLHAASGRARGELERKLNDRLGRICFYFDHGSGPDYLERARRYHLRHGLLWAIAPISRLLGAAIAVGIAVSVTTLLNALQLRKHPLKLTLERLLNSFASTTYLANCYNYSGRPKAAFDAAECLVPLVYSRMRMPRVGYLMARVYALYLMDRLEECADGCEEALRVIEYDKVTPVSEHDRVHATGGALITLLWADFARGFTESSRWLAPLDQYVQEHPTALLESWRLEAWVYLAFRRGNLAETEAAWTRFIETASQAEVMYVQNRTKVWVGMAYLNAGRTSEAQDLADEVIRRSRTADNPYILALGLHLRGLALHAWEQLDDAESSLLEAAELAGRIDVGCVELLHSVQLSLAELALDRGDMVRATELAMNVIEHAQPLKLGRNLHLGCGHRIVGRVALCAGELKEAVHHLQEAVALLEQSDDALERARAQHYLALALAAKGDEAAADQKRRDCVDILKGFGNSYQLRKLGHETPDSPESGPSANIVARVVRLVSGSNNDLTITENADDRGLSAHREPGAGEPGAGSQGSNRRDQTLIAGDSSEDLKMP